MQSVLNNEYYERLENEYTLEFPKLDECLRIGKNRMLKKSL